MRIPFEEILLRTKEGPIIEEQAFDMSLFRKILKERRKGGK